MSAGREAPTGAGSPRNPARIRASWGLFATLLGVTFLWQSRVPVRAIDLFIACDTDPGEAEIYPPPGRAFDPEADLISLHYDFAPDRDDVHSAAADRTLLQGLFGADWMCDHALPAAPTHGRNAFLFIGGDADRAMTSVWGVCGGHVDAGRSLGHRSRRTRAAQRVAAIWLETLRRGGDVWIKEGGQSDLTAAALRVLKQAAPDVDTGRRIHLVQHSRWNEDWTGERSLRYVRAHTDYVRIPNANGVLCSQDADRNRAFVEAATGDARFAPFWEAAFELKDPRRRLDFSDTTELLYILGWRDGFTDLGEFRSRFFARGGRPPSRGHAAAGERRDDAPAIPARDRAERGPIGPGGT